MRRIPPILPLAVTLGLLALPGVASSQVADPVPGAIPLGPLRVGVEVVLQLPDSGPASRPRARPMFLGGDGTGRRFVADQNGRIYRIRPNDSLALFLDVGAHTALFTDQLQRGVSGFAFHPDYHVPGAPGEGRFYTASAQTTASGTPDFPAPPGSTALHHSVIHEWRADPNNSDVIDPTSVREVLRVGEPHTDHNLGWIAFDPTLGPSHPDYGLLYAAFGDGGNTGCCPFPVVDPWSTGQDLSHPAGAMLRLDPLAQPGGAAYGVPARNPFAQDGDPATLGEIWAYGLRNPHTFSWDTGGDGALLIADIGQSSLEEVNRGAAGANYGWSVREGTFLVQRDDSTAVYPLPANDAQLGFTYPVLQYDHDEGDRAVSGGFVLRTPGIGLLAGRYVFGDLASGRVFHAPAVLLDGTGVVPFEELRLVDTSDGQPKSLTQMIGIPRADLRFGRDDADTVYLLTKTDGRIRRLVPDPACSQGPDADGDGVADACDGCAALADAAQRDTDGDLFGNVCDCDFDQDGACGIGDFNVFLSDFTAATDSGAGTDMDGDGQVGITDFNLFLPGFAAGVPGPSGVLP